MLCPQQGSQASTSRSVHPDATKQQTGQQKNKPDLQRMVDLLQQLQQSQNAVDMPDLVQQLLMRSAGALDSSTGNSAILSKCKSFTEGTNPVLQEEKRDALAARLKVGGIYVSWLTATW